MRTIYMVGHSSQTMRELIAKLSRHGVEVLIDVRNYPFSKWAPQFNRDNLDISLSEAGFTYRSIPSLGGLNPKPCSTILSILKALFNDQRVMCLMCSESDFMKCHRH